MDIEEKGKEKEINDEIKKWLDVGYGPKELVIKAVRNLNKVSTSTEFAQELSRLKSEGYCEILSLYETRLGDNYMF
jgi:hypothetical protein